MTFTVARITRQDILHIDPSNAAATIVGDLAEPGLLPPRTFDCIILTQTLQYVFDFHIAVDQVHGALRPGGVLLVTVPGVAPISPDEWEDSYYWRFTEPSLKRLLIDRFDAAQVATSPFGNFYAATAFLRGAAVEEIKESELQAVMPEYAIIIAARAVA
jgi:SAM-dependent methyltransferase